MTIILLLVLAVLLLAIFVFLEMMELALGTIAVIVVMSTGAVWMELATKLTVFVTLGIAVLVIVGLVVYRHMHRSAPQGAGTPGNGPEKSP